MSSEKILPVDDEPLVRRSVEGIPNNQRPRTIPGDTLVATKSNPTRATDVVGISIRTLRTKLNKYRIEKGIGLAA